MLCDIGCPSPRSENGSGRLSNRRAEGEELHRADLTTVMPPNLAIPRTELWPAARHSVRCFFRKPNHLRYEGDAPCDGPATHQRLTELSILPRQERSSQTHNHGKHRRTRKGEVDLDSLFRVFRWIPWLISDPSGAAIGCCWTESAVRICAHLGCRGNSKSSDPTGLQVLKKCRVSGRRHFCHPTSFQGRGCENGRSTEDPASGS